MAKPKLGSAKKASNQMTLMNLTAGKCVSQAIAVAAELGIPDLLKDRPRTAAEIARTASASKDGVYRLLRALASVGLFAEAGNRKFRLTPLGRLLRTDSSQTLGGYARFVGDQSTWRPWGELRHSVRTGEPAFDRVFAMPIFEYVCRDCHREFETLVTAARQPECVVMISTSFGAIIAPRLEPLLQTPIASVRASGGTHTDTAFANAGHAPASPTASKLRSAPRLIGPLASDVAMPAALHQLTASVRPRPTPRRSSTQPASGRASA